MSPPNDEEEKEKKGRLGINSLRIVWCSLQCLIYWFVVFDWDIIKATFYSCLCKKGNFFHQDELKGFIIDRVEWKYS